MEFRSPAVLGDLHGRHAPRGQPRSRAVRVMPMSIPSYDICVIGGAGHVGAPLAVVFAAADFARSSTTSTTRRSAPSWRGDFRSSSRAAKSSCSRRSPRDSSRILAPGGRCRGRRPGRHDRHADLRVPESRLGCRHPLRRGLLPHMRNTKLLILRSTVAPGTTDRLQQFLSAAGSTWPSRSVRSASSRARRSTRSSACRRSSAAPRRRRSSRPRRFSAGWRRASSG